MPTMSNAADKLLPHPNCQSATTMTETPVCHNGKGTLFSQSLKAGNDTRGMTDGC